MPQTLNHAGPALAITIQGPANLYAPGDDIIGHISRQSQIVSPRATIVVSLHGRAKTKLTKTNPNAYGSTTSHFRGRFDLVSQSRHAVKPFEGPLHISPGSEAHRWPFSITIPSFVDKGLPRPASQSESFLAMSLADVADLPLPPTFSASNSGFGRKSEAFVEYYLHARLVDSGHGSDESAESVLPVFVRSLVPQPPLVNFDHAEHRSSCRVTTQRIIPGMEDVKLAFSQKIKKHLGSSSVPAFCFHMRVQVPQTLQLDHPETIPLFVRILPDWQNTSEIIKGVPQRAKLTSLSMQIVSHTRYLCGGTFRAHDGHFSKTVNLIATKIKNHVQIPSSDESPPLHLGELFNLRLGNEQIAGPGRITPDFKTYNLQHNHSLKWEILGEIGGEEFHAAAVSKLTILPASDDRAQRDPASPSNQTAEAWIQPPGGDEAPPTFAEVKKEDLAQMNDGFGTNDKESRVKGS